MPDLTWDRGRERRGLAGRVGEPEPVGERRALAARVRSWSRSIVTAAASVVPSRTRGRCR